MTSKKPPLSWQMVVVFAIGALTALASGIALLATGQTVPGVTVLVALGGVTAYKTRGKWRPPPPILVLVLGASLFTACGGSWAQRGTGALHVAETGWIQFDRVHRMSLVEPVRGECGCNDETPPECSSTGTPACVRAVAAAGSALHRYDAKAQKIDAAVLAAYRLLALAQKGDAAKDVAIGALNVALQMIQEMTGGGK